MGSKKQIDGLVEVKGRVGQKGPGCRGESR